jgi:hypothetical protein
MPTDYLISVGAVIFRNSDGINARGVAFINLIVPLNQDFGF